LSSKGQRSRSLGTKK